MYRKVFLDANILVDLYDTGRPYASFSYKSVMKLLQNEEVQLFTSCDIVTILYYLRAKSDKVQALSDIEHLNHFCTIIAFGNSEVTKSCRLMKQHKAFSDLEDTIQYVMAKKVNAELILSNDKAFYSDGIPVMDTKKFCQEYGL
jgi:predicted nucleic acid-binding protein